MAALIRRIFGTKDDAQAGGSTYDFLNTPGPVAIPDADTFYPAISGTLNRNLTRQGRENEARGRRPVNPPMPFQARPEMQVGMNTYLSMAKKALKKALGGTDSVTGAAGTGYTHTIIALGQGAVVLPAVHAQLVRDDLNQKMSGGVYNQVTFNFPDNDNGNMEHVIQGLYHQNFATAAPSFSVSNPNEEPLFLRDAQMWLDGANEVQTATISGGPPTAGNFILSAQGFPDSAAILYNSTVAAFQTAMDGMFGAGQTVVTGSTGGPWTVTFSGPSVSGRDMPTLVLKTNTMTGGASPTLNIATATPGGTPIPDFTGLTFAFMNNVAPKWYAKRNVVSQTIGTPAKLRRVWFPQENKMNAAQDVTYTINTGNTNVAQELALEYDQIQKMVFEAVGAPITGTTPAVSELLRITIYAGVHTDGGAGQFAARDDIMSSFSGTAFYSEADGADIKVEILDAVSAPTT